MSAKITAENDINQNSTPKDKYSGGFFLSLLNLKQINV